MDTNTTDYEFERNELIKILELTSDKIVILDSMYSIKYANELFCKAVGCNTAEIIGRKIFSIPQINELWNKYEMVIKKDFNIEEKWNGEIERKDSTSMKHWERVSISVIKDMDNKIKNYIVMAQDITANKHIENGFGKCREHYNCIFEQNQLITLLIDPESGEIIEANEVACKFYGYKNDEFKKKNISEISFLTSEEILKKLGNSNEECTLFCEPPGKYFKQRLANGEIRDVEIFSKNLSISGKNVLYCVVHDISYRKKAENRLKESEERYRLLVELSPDAILVYDYGIILYANNKAALSLGLKNSSELIGRNVMEFIHVDFREEVKQRIYNAQVNKEILPLAVHKVVNVNGEILDIEAVGAPLIYEGKEAVQLVLRDVTDRRREITRAVKIQEQRQILSFPLREKVYMETIYKPAKLLSGDFYQFYKVNDDIVVGFLGDVTGKGITAALNISAMKVIFNEGVSKTHNPMELIQYMNGEVEKHLGEDYVSCCCFEINFKTEVLRITGAGINEFIKIDEGNSWEKLIIEGPPLGMFNNISFQLVEVAFSKGDIFNFYSDGMEFIINYDELSREYKSLVHDKLKTFLENRIKALSQLEDDCTWLSLKII